MHVADVACAVAEDGSVRPLRALPEAMQRMIDR